MRWDTRSYNISIEAYVCESADSIESRIIPFVISRDNYAKFQFIVFHFSVFDKRKLRRFFCNFHHLLILIDNLIPPKMKYN